MLAATSDVGALRRVLLHRPGRELTDVAPENADELLFDSPVDLARADEEHRALCATLSEHGVEVLHLEDLLAELGVEAEIPPNLMFTRDLGVVVGPGLHVGRMALPVRAAETELMRTVVQRHPLFEGVPLYSDGDIAVEGGDVVLAGDGVVVIGIGPRTTLTEARALAARLLDAGAAETVVAAVMPVGGPFHLDLALTFADRSVVVADPAVVPRTSAVVLARGRPPHRRESLLGALQTALGRGLAVVEAGDDAHGREWDRGTNVLAISPGVVVAYDDNVVTRTRLQSAGIEVVVVPGAALGHGRGGPRCLSLPLLRDD